MILLSTYALAILFAGFGALALSGGPRNGAPLIGMAGLVGAALLIAASWLMPLLIFDHETYLGDLWTAFEGANKAASGLSSSSDYVSPIGPMYDWVFRAALALRPLTATTVPLASALMALGVMILGVAILWRQVSLAALGMVLLLAVATVVSPREADTLIAQTSMSWLAPYNRWASGLAVVLTVALCLPAKGRGVIGAALIGAGIAGLLLLKITYGAALLGLVVIAVILRTLTLWHLVILVTGLAGALAAADAMTGQIAPYLGDLRSVAALEANGLRPIQLVQQLGEAALWAGGAILLYAALCGATGQAMRLRAVLLLVVAAAMGCAILMQNHWLSESAIYAALPIIAAEWTSLLHSEDDSPEMPTPLWAGLAGLCVALSMLYPIRDGGTVLAQVVQAQRFAPDPALAGTPQADFLLHERWRFDPTSGPAQDYTRMIEAYQALDTLGAGLPQTGTTLALNFSNPFPMLLGKPSPKRAPIWLHEGRSFSADSYIPAEEMFDGVDFIAVAVGEGSGEALWQIYQPYIEAHFERVTELDAWMIWAR
ncbi:hypothetical protein [Tropicibacter naphthalenivorans]|uniref:Glycosyltransferase RgtA/B/C/D-like domain-containing protein n=1 Tax=Tropicibacter naphthalenivorans TaxID=441103 RepID=A0A0P1GWK0_9RHOB|nr:hypothetical protein [Tropicibacter naphthalenivorans]CUH79480.1 hypothetical protein TRN7648_02494 [Tropicibacter naphthalenivorans]SMC72988.1 hypothetical protein SAMN04488093_103123 [Tropicibacter naphthalenivorans]